jgi:hypothetical protein
MWIRVVTALLLGYLCMGRSFAYWGIPPIHLFVGEAVLGLFLVFLMTSPRATAGWDAIGNPQLRRLKRAFWIFFAFGLFQVLRGIYIGHAPLLALRDLAFNYYSIYFVLGLWVGLNDPDYLAKFFRLAAWTNGIYGLLFVTFLSRVSWSFPAFTEDGPVVPVFGQPSYSGLILLGLLSFEKDLRRVWPLLLLNTAVLLGMLIRAEWVALILGVVIWCWFKRDFKKVALVGSMVPLLLLLMYVTGFSIPGPETRGGTVSATELAARVIAPVNSDVAASYGSAEEDLHMYEGNAVWRTMYWLAIWNGVHENAGTSFLGLGYGYPLSDLLPDLIAETTRTPHNVFIYVLGYTGWIGVAIFASLQLQLFKLLRRAGSNQANPFGIVSFGALLVFACFTPFFETPQGAIPFYLLIGCACAPLVRAAMESAVRTSRQVVLAPSEGV